MAEIDQEHAKLEELAQTSEAWRRAELRWQAWADALLSELGQKPDCGTWGDSMARALIEEFARRGKR